MVESRARSFLFREMDGTLRVASGAPIKSRVDVYRVLDAVAFAKVLQSGPPIAASAVRCMAQGTDLGIVRP